MVIERCEERECRHPARFFQSLVLLLLCFSLAACGSRPEFGALALNTAPAPDAEAHDILIVTTRAKDDHPDTYFNGERSKSINYAEATISVPAAHEAGQVEWPDSLPGNPDTDFVTRKAGYISGKASFTNDVNRRLAKLPRGEREIFVFIHGYNNRFPEALFRFAQVVHDSDFPGVPVMFSWASRGKLQDYVYDLNSAAIARQALEQALVQLAGTKAEKVTILAHSMGNWLLMEMAVQASPQSRRKLARKIDHVILAAPDIDVDLFKAQLKKIGPPRNPYFVIVSRDDKALKLSRKIAGGKERVGAYSKDQELTKLGAIVVDVTELESQDSANHSKFAQLARLSPELRRTLGLSGLTAASDMSGHPGTGNDLGSLVGDTVALPIRVITAPFTATSGGL